MIETYLRDFVQPLFDALGRVLIALRLSPNTITFFALVSGLAAAYCIATNNVPAAFALMLLSGLWDIMDGTVARLTHNAQKIGAYMDLIVDRLVESFIILGFYLLSPEHALAYLICMTAIFFHFSTFIVAGALFTNTSKKSMHYDKSIIERTEAFVAFGLMMWYPAYIFEVLMVFSVATALSGVARFFSVWWSTQQAKTIRKKKKNALA